MAQLVGKWITDATIKVAKLDKDTATAKQVIAVNAGGTAAEYVSIDHSYVSDFDTGVRENRLDQMAAPSGTVDFNGQTITGVGAPSNGSDAVNKDALDSAIAASGTAAEWQDSVLDRLATPPGSPSTGDRYLIIATATDVWASKEDQIATWTGSAWEYAIPTTGTYVGVDDESDGLYYYGGSSWSKQVYEATTASNGLTKSGLDIQVNPTLAGDGLAFATGVMSVNVDDSTIEIATDTLQVPAGGITGTELASSVAGNGLAGGGGSPLSVGGGTGISVSADQVAIDTTANLTMTGQMQFSNLRVNEAVQVTATSTELNILDGLTATTAELNYLDNADLTSADIQKLADLTATATELNLLDGITGILDEDDMSSDSATSLATQQSIKAYVDTATDNVNGRITEGFTCDATIIANKSVTLAATPANAASTVLHVQGAPHQEYGSDFTVSGTTLSWNGLGLDGLLEAGDKLRVVYDA